MGKPNSARKIRERREEILILMSKGMKQKDIAKRLGVNRNTIMRDMVYVNEMTKHGLYDLAKTTLNTMFFNCIQGLDEWLDECWRIYNNEDNNPDINHWHRIAAARLGTTILEKKFDMFINGPAMMQLNSLDNTLKKLKHDAIKDMNARNGGVGMFKKPLTDQELEDIGVANLKALDDENSLIDDDNNGTEKGSILDEENINSPLYHHSHDEYGRHYKEGEVVFKEGSSVYVYHSNEYNHKLKLGILTEEEKRQAEETTKQCWKRYEEERAKEKERERINNKWMDENR